MAITSSSSKLIRTSRRALSYDGELDAHRCSEVALNTFGPDHASQLWKESATQPPTYYPASEISSAETLLSCNATENHDPGPNHVRYDETDQLTDANYSDSQGDESYAYDDNGNRIGTQVTDAGSQAYDATAGSNNQLLDDGTYTYQYDAEGNRISRTNKSTLDYTTYSWDHRNRLTSVVDYDANGTISDTDDVVTQSVSYTYDVFNQLIGREVDTDGAVGSTPLEKTVYVYHDGQIVLQFDDTGTSDLAAGDLSHRYLWGEAVDQLLADEQVDWSDTDADGDILWPLTDHLGSVRDIADSTGAILNHIVYDAFGNVISETTPSVDVEFGYTGRQFDNATGLQNNLNRWYDSNIGRWISLDPVGFDAGDSNLYRYVGNGSTGQVDPTGFSAEGAKGNSGSGGTSVGSGSITASSVGGSDSNVQIISPVGWWGELGAGIGGFGAGLAQGGANIGNGLTNGLTSLGNAYIYAANEVGGGLDIVMGVPESERWELPYIPESEWSRGA